MKVIFYKGEDITLTFTAEEDLSAYTPVVKVFTPFSEAITAAVTVVDENNFTAKITASQTSSLSAGQFNIVLELTDASNDVLISKRVSAKLLDPYTAGGERESVTSLNNEIVFIGNLSMYISFIGGGSGGGGDASVLPESVTVGNADSETINVGLTSRDTEIEVKYSITRGSAKATYSQLLFYTGSDIVEFPGSGYSTDADDEQLSVTFTPQISDGTIQVVIAAADYDSDDADITYRTTLL